MKKSIEKKNTNKRLYIDRIKSIKRKNSVNPYIKSEIIVKNIIENIQPN